MVYIIKMFVGKSVLMLYIIENLESNQFDALYYCNFVFVLNMM